MQQLPPADRQLAADIWGVPVENIDPAPSYHTVAMFRALDRGDFGFPAEIIVIDLLARRDGRSYSAMVLEFPEPPAARTTAAGGSRAT